jgi:8-oxo-dGTP diphosphatase
VTPDRAPIVVAAAVIELEGKFLLTRRQPGVHLEGLWEFPGGKCRPGESLTRCLARELEEELAVAAEVGAEMLTVAHEYPDRAVEMHFLRCRLLGEPVPQLGQEMRWVAREELRALDFPPADHQLLDTLLRLNPNRGGT